MKKAYGIFETNGITKIYEGDITKFEESGIEVTYPELKMNPWKYKRVNFGRTVFMDQREAELAAELRQQQLEDQEFEERIADET